MNSLPLGARPHLEYLLDRGNEGVETDLCEIAEQMINWEVELSTYLGLTAIDIHDITKGIDDVKLQR